MMKNGFSCLEYNSDRKDRAFQLVCVVDEIEKNGRVDGSYFFWYARHEHCLTGESPE